MKTILITGGTGFIGRHLCQRLIDLGWHVIVISRNVATAGSRLPAAVELIGSLGGLSAETEIDAVINLAGEPLAAGRWNEPRKKKFIDSRIGTTDALYRFFAAREQKPKVLIV